MEGKHLFCQDCNAPCSRDYKNVSNIVNYGSVIYVHNRKDSLQYSSERCSKEDEKYILHNITDELKKTECTAKLHQHKAKCFQCERVVQKVRSLLDELTKIRDNKILGLCEHCKRSKSTKKCPRCAYILKKFLSDKNRQCEERQNKLKVWLCRVRNLLQAISDKRNVCQHKVDQDPVSNLELRNLLRQLKAPLTVHEPICELFPLEKDMASLQNMTESKYMIDDLILKLAQPDKKYTSDDSLYASPSKMCICKYFKDEKFTGTLPQLDFGYKAEKGKAKGKIGTTSQMVKGKTEVDEILTNRESGKTESTVHGQKSGTQSAFDKQIDGGKGKIGSSGHRLKGMMSAQERKQEDRERSKFGSTSRRLKGKMSAHETQEGRERSKIGSTSRKLKGKMSAHEKQTDAERNKMLSAGHKSKGKISAEDKKKKIRETISKEDKSKSGEKGKAEAPDDKSLKTASIKPDEDLKSEEDLAILQSLKDRRLSRKDPGKTHKSTEMTEEEKMLFNLLQEFKKQKHDKQVGTPHKQYNERRPMQIASLPALRRKEHQSLKNLVTESESFIECAHHEEPPEMIKDTEIVPYDPHYKDKKKGTGVPLLFEMYSPDYACPDPDPHTLSPTSATDMYAVKRSKSSKILKFKGAFSYELSNRYFIDKGITKLPTEKIMRKMNVYRMESTYPNWFAQNKSLTKFYNTGEILAEVNEDCSGKWYYKNGVVALEYHINAEDPGSGQRYVIYSTGKDFQTGKYKPQTVLASFDFLGNGVVYDHNGNIRLKYNQSEGLIVDQKIAPPAKWKWHTLNDPPNLQHIYINTNLKKRDPILEKFYEMQEKQTKEITKDQKTNRMEEQEARMLSIELDNFVKEKATKLLQEFKPFQIRMKAVKLNDHFSVKIFDQANIRVFFRDAGTSLKLNIGMALINNEIIDTDTAEMSEVETPYDKRPARTKSVENIQKMIDRVRKEGKTLRASAW